MSINFAVRGIQEKKKKIKQRESDSYELGPTKSTHGTGEHWNRDLTSVRS